MNASKHLMLALFVVVTGTAFGFDGSGMNAARQTALSGDSMKYLGHASVKIKTAQGKVIYIDPYAGTDYADSADVVLVTHQHSDHNAINLVKRKTACVTITNAQAIIGDAYQSFAIGEIQVDAVAAYNTDNNHHLKSSCVGYVLEFSGIKLYHAGDTGLIPEMADLAARKIDYALLPMDGMYSMTPEQAAQAVAMIQPKHAIPIHTMPPPDTYNDAIVARFTDPSKLVVRPGETIALAASSTAVGESSAMPETFRLKQNYPNPFNPVTTIEFSIPETGFATLKVYDVVGKEIAVLVERTLRPGPHRVEFDASSLASGVYLYRLDWRNQSLFGRMLLMK
jgi:L-ascorbate metabolism protein UlaG (beta-lactamase superfamily)